MSASREISRAYDLTPLKIADTLMEWRCKRLKNIIALYFSICDGNIDDDVDDDDDGSWWWCTSPALVATANVQEAQHQKLIKMKLCSFNNSSHIDRSSVTYVRKENELFLVDARAADFLKEAMNIILQKRESFHCTVLAHMQRILLHSRDIVRGNPNNLKIHLFLQLIIQCKGWNFLEQMNFYFIVKNQGKIYFNLTKLVSRKFVAYYLLHLLITDIFKVQIFTVAFRRFPPIKFQITT